LNVEDSDVPNIVQLTHWSVLDVLYYKVLS